MEKRRRVLVILGAAALLFAILAGIVLWQRAAEGQARYTPVTFLPGFADKAKDAARIEVSGHDGRFAVELTPSGWVLRAWRSSSRWYASLASSRSRVWPVGAVSSTTKRSVPRPISRAKARKTAISSVHGERRSSSSRARAAGSSGAPWVRRTSSV